MDDTIESKLVEWVDKNYHYAAVYWTPERSEGNSNDCFWDGYERGTSEAAFEIGRIIGMFTNEKDND